ncbi:hypothetical protein [Psychromonas sp.]|uniref:hypothetical protein n=1 Tax=Psychromonas sp. TaxID=1884585 RepID=UPI003561F2DD
MYDFIESLQLRDQALEELYLAVLIATVSKKAQVKTEGEDEDVDIVIDDKDHKFYFKHHE